MLTNLLAWSMAIASLGLYLLGFFLPELYRRFDLVASGAGLFFALTLWIYGDRIGGGLLLGTAAAVALILWFGWQTLSYRWQLTYPGDRTDTQKAQALWQKVQSLLPEGSLAKIGEQLQGLISRLRNRRPQEADQPQRPVDSPPPPMDTGDMKQDLWTGETSPPSTVQPPPSPEPTTEEPVEAEPTPVQETMTSPEPSAAATIEPPPESPQPSERVVETPPASVAPEEPVSPETGVDAPEATTTPEAVVEPPPAFESAPDVAKEPDPIPTNPPLEHSETTPPTAAAAESRTSAAELLGEIPESSDSEDEVTSEGTTIENPEHTTPEDDDWPPREARL